MKPFLRSNWLSILVIVGLAAWAFLQSSTLPDQMPSHFDIDGNADNYQNKFFVLAMLPLVNLVVILLIGFTTKVSPRGYEMPNSQNVVGLFNLGITAFLMALYVGMILEGKTPGTGISQKFMAYGFSILMVFMGNYFGKLERNFFIGIRVPWTLASDENWKQTHRFAGKLFVVGGVVALVLSFFQVPFWIVFLTFAFASLASVGFSFYYFCKNEKTSN